MLESPKEMCLHYPPVQSYDDDRETRAHLLGVNLQVKFLPKTRVVPNKKFNEG